MCDIRRVIASATIAILAGVLTAEAQTPATLQTHLERLRREHAAALAAAQRADSVRVANVRIDTIRAGALTVLAPPGTAGLAGRAATEAWRVLDARFGRGAQALAGIEFVLQQQGAPDVTPRAPTRDVRPLTVPARTTADELAPWLAVRAAGEVSTRQDSAFRAWFRSAVDPLSDSTRRNTDVYVELVTKPWTVVKRCYLGDLDGCRDALGLAPGVDPLDQWYDAEDRRRLVAATAAEGLHADHPQQRSACVDRGDADACTKLLRQMPVSFVEPPLPSGPRALLGLTLDLGGPGAYDRLMASPQRSLADRLSAASGLSPDSLLATWRARVLAARPLPVTLSLAGAWAALAWVLVFGALALQSTRWR